MKHLNVLPKFENHFAIETVRFQVQLEADGYFLDLPYFFLHPAESDVFSKVRVCEATKAPVGLLSDRTVLRSKMEGPYPDKFT